MSKIETIKLDNDAVYIELNGWTYYIDDTTDEQIMEKWETPATVAVPPLTDLFGVCWLSVEDMERIIDGKFTEDETDSIHSVLGRDLTEDEIKVIQAEMYDRWLHRIGRQ